MVDIATIREGFELIEKGMRKLNGGPMDYYITNLTDCYQLLLDKYAPFKVGDRVLLTETPDIDKSSGWYSCRHFLVKGAIGTVRQVDVDKNGFAGYVEFDQESWIPDFDSESQGIKKGVKVMTPPERRHIYGFKEHKLVKIPS
jgi:hypothetical protein